MKAIEIVLIGLLIVSLILLRKVDNGYRNFLILGQAVYYYNVDCIKCGNETLLDYDECFPDNKIWLHWLNIFDWTYYNILPQETFELLLPYLDDAEKWFDEKHGKGSKNRQ